MNYLISTLILFILFYLGLYFQSIHLEKFESEEQCIDEETNQIRTITPSEKQEIDSKKDSQKKESQDKKEKADEEEEKDKEVFLIYNKYNYLEAKEICKLYSGRLATEKDLNRAFKKGANWCTWGWIDGEAVAYPVQEKYWTDVEKIHRGFCGPTAGINKIKDVDPFKRFGVTCYGIKPKRTNNDKDMKSIELNEMNKMDSLSKAIMECKKEKQIEEQKKWIEKQMKLVSILSFNDSKWSILEKKEKDVEKKEKPKK